VIDAVQAGFMRHGMTFQLLAPARPRKRFGLRDPVGRQPQEAFLLHRSWEPPSLMTIRASHEGIILEKVGRSW
jgi:hypothetical protein